MQPDVPKRPAKPSRSSKDPSRFFCPHPIGGNVFCHVALSKWLGARHSLYGLQAQGLDAEQDPLVSVEDMAETYIHAMRRLLPEGPYRLAGWCFGGLIAFEVFAYISDVRNDKIWQSSIKDIELASSQTSGAGTTMAPRLDPPIVDQNSFHRCQENEIDTQCQSAPGGMKTIRGKQLEIVRRLGNFSGLQRVCRCFIKWPVLIRRFETTNQEAVCV